MASRQAGSRRTGRHPTKQEREEWRIRQAAFTAEKLLDDILERKAAAISQWEDLTLRRLAPEPEDIHIYPLTERTEEMSIRDWWYRYNVSTSVREPEVTLELCERRPNGRLSPMAVVGDLYRLTLHHTNGTEFRDVNILVESLESARAEGSLLFYSCFDACNTDTALSVPLTAWQNYLAFRSDEDGIKQEMDTRLLYIAMCNLSSVGPSVTLDAFRDITTGQLNLMRSEMRPGRFYMRPDTTQAQLATQEGITFELLRMSPVVARTPPTPNYYSIRRRTAHWQEGQPRSFSRQPSIAEVALGASYSPRSSRSSSRSSTSRRARRSARLGGGQGASVAPSVTGRELPKCVMDLIASCLNPTSEENTRSRELGRSLAEAARRSPRGGPLPRSWESPSSTMVNTSERASTTSSTADTTSPPGAELSVMEESCVITSTRSSLNLSEYEAMGDTRMFVDDLAAARHESSGMERSTQTMTDFSLISGIAHLAVTLNSTREGSEEGRSADVASSEEGRAQQGNLSESFEMNVSLGTGRNLNVNIGADTSFPFEDSLTLWLASPHNESRVVTISTTDDSANQSGLLENYHDGDDDRGPEGRGHGGRAAAVAIARGGVVHMRGHGGRQGTTPRTGPRRSLNDDLLDEECCTGVKPQGFKKHK